MSTYWPPPRLGLAGILLCLCSCGGSGGGSGSFADAARLLSVEFPDPQGVNATPETDPPLDAPLLQQVVFGFDEVPDPDTVNRLTVQVLDDKGLPARGRYTTQGTQVRFTPDLPLRPPVDLGGSNFDGGGAGLDPGRSYSVRIGPGTWSFVGAIEPELLARFADPADPRNLLIAFATTTDPDRYFKGVEARRPRVVSSSPGDGAVGVGPQLYTDPDGLFPPRSSFRLEFDGPLEPSPQNLAIQLVDVDDDRAGPGGLPLGTYATILENRLDRSVVEVQPSGILPFGHLLSLEIPEPLASVSELPAAMRELRVVAQFTTATAPDQVRDLLAEDFDSRDRQDPDPSLLSTGQIPAEWDRLDSDVLTASFAFDGAGELGRFAPSPPPDGETRTVILDTNLQVFPLLDGSTPDAPPGYEVRGGLFHFTTIDVPKNVTVVIRGVNPARLTATGSVRIAGIFDLSGRNGTPENAFDSAITSIPGGLGGSGGGRGGEAHPIVYWPPDQFGAFNLVSPLRGGNGFSALDRDRTGGEGGESGQLDRPKDGVYSTNQEIACAELPAGPHDNNDFGAGGSGGSYLSAGTQGRLGAGNVRPDGRGGWNITPRAGSGGTWKDLYPGRIGISPFKDADPDNDYLGIGGELVELLGGQGGGAGGSRSEAYYCGTWCKTDADPTNDACCQGGESGGAFADSVGDARGGSAGGGGGALMIQTLGDILLTPASRILCTGGAGRGGEVLGNSRWGGPAAGGSGGAIVLQAAGTLEVRNGARLDVRPGGGSGTGGNGLIQLQTPVGSMPTVDSDSSILPIDSWVDRDNVRNPSRFTSFSVAVSRWFDMGRTIDRPPASTNPVFAFAGLDADGFVRTDDEGNVIDPELASIRCDYLGQIDPLRGGDYRDGQQPRSNFIPPNASVRVEFQYGDAITLGSREVDPASLSAWTADASEASGRQFLRYRITFDITADGSDLRADAPRPSVQSLGIEAGF